MERPDHPRPPGRAPGPRGRVVGFGGGQPESSYLHRPHLVETNTVHGGRIHRRLAHQDLTGAGSARDGGRDVHRPSEVVTVPKHHGPGVHPDVGGRHSGPSRLRHQVECTEDGLSGIGEVKHDAVAQPVDRSAPAPLRFPLDGPDPGRSGCARGVVVLKIGWH